MKRWMALLLAGLLVFPQAMVLRAEELIDGYAETDGVGHEEGMLDNAIEEINSASDISEFTDVESEDLISVESPEEYTEELCDEPKEVSANSSTPFITGFYNSTRGGDIRWSNVDGAAGYVLYRMRSADGLKKVATINNPDTLQRVRSNRQPFSDKCIPPLKQAAEQKMPEPEPIKQHIYVFSYDYLR